MEQGKNLKMLIGYRNNSLVTSHLSHVSLNYAPETDTCVLLIKGDRLELRYVRNVTFVWFLIRVRGQKKEGLNFSQRQIRPMFHQGFESN